MVFRPMKLYGADLELKYNFVSDEARENNLQCLRSADGSDSK